MQRRQFLKTVGAGTLGLMVIPGLGLLSGCDVISDAQNKGIAWMSPDGKVLYALDRTPDLYQSTDATNWDKFATRAAVGQNSLSGVWTLADGELLIARSPNPYASPPTPGSLWRSVGYPSSGVQCGWHQVLQCGYEGAVGEPAPATPIPGGTITGITGPQQMWTLSLDGSIVLCCEYGEQHTGNKSRYVYLSTDTARTFTRVFDIGDAEGVHTHGVCYDPYWDALWLTCCNDTQNVYLSNDHGRTWGSVACTQDGRLYRFTSIAALPSCVVLGSDDRSFNGVARIPRPTDGTRDPSRLRIEPADTFNIDGTVMTNIGNQTFTAQAPGSLTYMAFIGQSGGNARVVSTTDGYAFDEPWYDQNTTSPTDGVARGASYVVGPDIHQRVYITSFNDGRYSSGPSRITIIPDSA